ncbi:flagellar basal body P-ring protein FlgI [Buchnera aphidicola]|uniref:flagellar basal body P-ring protein FlgI n=1 Tax=Buchnera aphidicola TaxID=9 RepID=UPI00094D49E2|nr:flagellar basal body P-ring protein FlgI [Buchnera aphidicola]
MNTLLKLKYIIIMICIVFINIFHFSTKKIYNLIDISNMSNIPLIRYALVVGLNGTGDNSSKTP